VHRFDTTTPPQLAIEFRAGTIAITTADVAETTVDLQPRRDSQGARDLVAATTIEQRGNVIAVVVPKRFGNLLGRSSDLALTINAPHDSALAIGSDSADVVARGRFTTSTVATGSGDVDLDELTDSASVRSGSGAIRVRDVAGDLKVENGSGDVQVGRVHGSASVHTGSGDVTVAEGGAALEVKSGSGDVSVGSAPADVRIRTASGDIAIDTVSAGEVRAKAASGDIRAGIRAGTAAWLEVRTVSGKVSSDLDAGPAPDADEHRARLQLETVSGDIRLVRV
jgi:DUF4097 and DUF4098 domain-containing protein YvlB